jgi:hypothetical protein
MIRFSHEANSWMKCLNPNTAITKRNPRYWVPISVDEARKEFDNGAVIRQY